MCQSGPFKNSLLNSFPSERNYSVNILLHKYKQYCYCLESTLVLMQRRGPSVFYACSIKVLLLMQRGFASRITEGGARW